jgi:hypothetical protein
VQREGTAFVNGAEEGHLGTAKTPPPTIPVDVRLTLSLGLWGSEVRPDTDGVPRVWSLPPVDSGTLSRAALRVEDERVFLAPETFATRAGALLDLAAKVAGFSCCHLGAEIEVLVDGVRWEGTCPDHWWHIENWFPALLQVLRDDPAVAGAFVWDQSRLGLSRDGDRLTISDPIAPTIEVEMRPFAAALMREGRRLANAADALRFEVLTRGGPAAALEAMVPLTGPDKPTSPLPGNIRMVCAIIWRELRFLDALRATLDAIEEVLDSSR